MAGSPKEQKVQDLVLIAVLYDSLWFINVNEQNIKKEMGISVRSLLDEVETDQARVHERASLDSENEFEKRDEHETLELKESFQMLL
ncbi:hypothetical protein TNCV_1148721 [Trichonephila clavipes]|nr:hypothetical protein TNCV_1148721 [Trichonephila clavipes]